MQTINTIELYNIVAHLDEKIAEKKDTLATKDDIHQVKENILQLKADIKDQKAELLKWMIVLFTPFYIGMIVFLTRQFLP